ncbi:MAG: efflux RND transporter periplasmic adaptor subunit [Candidatus Dormibacteraceae bacterium]
MVVLEGVIVREPPIAVKATVAGIVDSLSKTAANHANQGERIMSIRAAGASIGTTSVAAPASGAVAGFDVIPGQAVTIGMVIAQFEPDTFDAVATVDPSLLYRFYGERPSQVLVQIEKGPAPFNCPVLSLGLPGAGGLSSSDATSQPVQLRCRIPPGTRVFAGIRCLLAATTGVAKDALIIPVTAVEGSAESGYVTLVGADGRRETRLVRLGLTDGIHVQVLEGLQQGDKILDLPPSIFPNPLVGGSHSP